MTILPAAAALLLQLSLSLTPIGDVEALDGKVVYEDGFIAAVSDENGAHSPFEKGTVKVPRNARSVADPEVCPRDKKVSSPVALAKTETAAAATTGSFGRVKKATVVLVRGTPAKDLFGYAPVTLRVFDGTKKVAEIAVGDEDVYPCEVLVDNFDGKPGNEIAVTWLSVGGGFTAGVTVYSSK